jgi:hypothetical protein
MTTAELDGLLNAHAYLRVERPPSLWAPQSELEPFVRMLGELIVVGLLRNGNVLGELTLNVSNVVVEPASAGPMPAGAFVAVTIRGRGDWSPETTRPDFAGGFVGMAVRVFARETRLWAIYWADGRTPGLLEEPMIGSFSDGVGIFECEELFEGRPITVRFTWSDITETSARWAQSFSEDGGAAWETNWTVPHTRV